MPSAAVEVVLVKAAMGRREVKEQEDKDGKEEEMIKKGRKKHMINATHRAEVSLLHAPCAP